jgi:hypothetical protein
LLRRIRLRTRHQVWDSTPGALGFRHACLRAVPTKADLCVIALRP